MRVILTGGGTLGPVTPLLAVAYALRSKNPDVKFLWIGTRKGPERKLVREKKINYKAIFSGKWRRYLSLRNFFDLFLIIFGGIQSFFILLRYKPDIIVSAGGFVAVPVCWAGWLLRIPIIIHQQDIQKGLANSLCASFAKKITTAFEKSLRDFPKEKTTWVGNPVRQEITEGSKEQGIKRFNLLKNVPTLLVLGGGTGSEFINRLILESLPELTDFCQIIHITGGRIEARLKDRYHSYKFLGREMANAYAVSDIIISRAGMGVLSELSALGKPSILLPLTGHQEKNAMYFAEEDGAVVLRERGLMKDKFIGEVKGLLEDTGRQRELGENIRKIFPKNAAENLAEVVWSCQKR